MGPTPFYGARVEKNTKKADFALKQTNICRLSGDIMIVTRCKERKYRSITESEARRSSLSRVMLIATGVKYSILYTMYSGAYVLVSSLLVSTACRVSYTETLQFA